MVSGPNDPGVVPLHRLPREVLAAILSRVVHGPSWLCLLRTLSAVCRHWHDVCRHDGLWGDIARRSFVAYPLLRDHGLCGGLSVPPSEEEVSPRREVALHLLPPPPPTLERLQLAYGEVSAYRDLLKNKELVAERQRYVLHMLVSFTLLFFTMAGLCFMCALEDVGPTEHFSIDNGFRFLYATFLLVATTVVANVTMTVHFEPADVYHRVHAHRRLIYLTIGVLVVMIIIAILPAYLVQRALAVGPQDRAQGIWTVCAAPPATAFAVWQLHVLFVYRRRIQGWWRRGRRLRSPSSLHTVMANLTPTMFACSVFGLAQYAEGRSVVALAFACVPILMACLVVSGLFGLDYLSRPNSRPVDGVAALCVLAAAFFPFSALLMPLRGFTALPLVLASGGFFCAHATETARLLSTLMESDAMFLLE